MHWYSYAKHFQHIDLLAISIIWLKHRPNSSMMSPSISTSFRPFRSASSAWANKHWQVASTTSLVTKLKGWRTPETGLKALPETDANGFVLIRVSVLFREIEVAPEGAGMSWLLVEAEMLSSPSGLRGPPPRTASIFLQPMHRQLLVQAILAS